MAGTIIGLFKAEVIRRKGALRTFGTVEYAPLRWIDWFNQRRLLIAICNIPRAELELELHQQSKESAMVALIKQTGIRSGSAELLQISLI